MTQRSSCSSSSPINKFDIFDLSSEESKIEKLSKKMLRNLRTPTKSPSPPISKYEFLQAFAVGSKPQSRIISIDLDNDEQEDAKCSPVKVLNKPLVVDDDDDDEDDTDDAGLNKLLEVGDDEDDAGLNGPLEVDDDEDDTGIDDDQGKNVNACSMDSPLQHFAEKESDGDAEFVDSDVDLENQVFDMLSDDDDDEDDEDDSSEMSSSSNSTFDHSKFEDCFEDHQVEDDSSAFKIDDIEKVVDVLPDFIQYEKLYSTSSRLIFSCSSLKLEGPTNNQTGKTFTIEWETEDIIKIESCWFKKIETAWINLLLRPKDSEDVGITNERPGFKLLKFAVYDSYWSKAEEAIKLLDTRYTNIWSTVFDIDADNYGNNSILVQDSLFSQRHYFPIFDEAFEEVIYPKGEPDAVSISKRDVALLQPETFVNDTIIDFYIKYLKNKLPTDEQERFHFFNSFFFRKLADLDKDPESASDGIAAFQRVRKWTRKVNLFEKDYILIPVNYGLHWSLIVICHPGEVPCFRDEEIKESSKVPCILHMDSLKGTHKGLKNLFQSYLCEEWKERHPNMADDFSSKFLQLRFISLELPQQDNLYDCGLFLLYFVERFLEEAPIKFNPFKITKFSKFLNNNWFPPDEASLRRSHIQNLIYDIFENSSLKAPSIDCQGKGPLSELPGVIEHKVEVDSSGASCYPGMWHGNPSNGSTETDIRFQSVSPVRAASCSSDPEIVFKDFHAAVVSPHFDCRQMSLGHQSGFLSPIEETEEFGDEVSKSMERANSQVGIFASGFPSTSYIGKDHRASETKQQGFPMNFVEPVEGLPYSNWIQDSLEDQPLEKIEESNIPNKIALEKIADSVVQDSEESNGRHEIYVVQDSQESNGGHEIYVVQDSQESNDVHEVDACVKSHSSFQDNINSMTHQILDLAQNTSVENDSLPGKREPPASESQERNDKRRKLTSETGGPSRRLTRRMLKETCV